MRNMTKHLEYLTAAQKLTDDNPELHAEYRRRQQAGEWFNPGEPVTRYLKTLTKLNKQALKAAGI